MRISATQIHLHQHTAWVDEHAAALTQLVCAAAAAQGDAAVSRAASATVHAALHSGAPAFLRTFSAALVKAAAVPSLLPGHALLLVRWVSVVLQSIDASAADKVKWHCDWGMFIVQLEPNCLTCSLNQIAYAHLLSRLQAVPKLLECQGIFMAAISPPSAHHTLWTAAIRSVLSVLRTTPSLLLAYTTAAAAHPGPELAHVVALHVASHADAPTHSTLLQLYCTRVLSSREVLSPDVYALYAAMLINGAVVAVLSYRFFVMVHLLIFLSVSSAEIEETLLPAATRSIKQRPEQGLHGCAAMLRALPNTDALAPLLLVLLHQARHAREAVQCVNMVFSWCCFGMV